MALQEYRCDIGFCAIDIWCMRAPCANDMAGFESARRWPSMYIDHVINGLVALPHVSRLLLLRMEFYSGKLVIVEIGGKD